jgi:hypothetical protein
MEVRRVRVKRKLVYAILAQKALWYPWGRSKVVYIGTTKHGMTRIAQSAASRADQVLSIYGVRKFDVRILTCASWPNVKTWVKLERALLIVFRRRYGALPKCNKVGKYAKPRDEFRYFRQERLERLLEELA